MWGLICGTSGRTFYECRPTTPWLAQLQKLKEKRNSCKVKAMGQPDSTNVTPLKSMHRDAFNLLFWQSLTLSK